MDKSNVTIGVTGQALVETPVAPPSAALRHVLSRSNMLFANFEATVLARDAWPTKTRTLHVAAPETLASLAAFGVTDVGHANNHAFDLGPPGIAATHAAAAAAGLSVTGGGANLEEASRPTIRTVDGVRVAILAADCGPQPEIVYAAPKRAGINPLRANRSLVVPGDDYATLARLLAETGEDRRQAGRTEVGYRDSVAAETLDFFGLPVERGAKVADMRRPNTDDLERMHARLAEARAAADVVLVSLHHHHWEPTWAVTPAWFTALGHDLIEHGADVIAGTGAPVLQPISFHRGRPILAGLGNLMFHTHRAERYDAQKIDVWTGAICLCRFDRSGFAGIEICPVAVGRPAGSGLAPAPEVLSGGEAALVFEQMTGGLSPDDRARVSLTV